MRDNARNEEIVKMGLQEAVKITGELCDANQHFESLLSPTKSSNASSTSMISPEVINEVVNAMMKDPTSKEDADDIKKRKRVSLKILTTAQKISVSTAGSTAGTDAIENAIKKIKKTTVSNIKMRGVYVAIPSRLKGFPLPPLAKIGRADFNVSNHFFES